MPLCILVCISNSFASLHLLSVVHFGTKESVLQCFSLCAFVRQDGSVCLHSLCSLCVLYVLKWHEFSPRVNVYTFCYDEQQASLELKLCHFPGNFKAASIIDLRVWLQIYTIIATHTSIYKSEQGLPFCSYPHGI